MGRGESLNLRGGFSRAHAAAATHVLVLGRFRSAAGAEVSNAAAVAQKFRKLDRLTNIFHWVARRHRPQTAARTAGSTADVVPGSSWLIRLAASDDPHLKRLALLAVSIAASNTWFRSRLRITLPTAAALDIISPPWQHI